LFGVCILPARLKRCSPRQNDLVGLGSGGELGYSFIYMFDFLDPVFLVKSAGIVGVVAIIFAESGLFFGFFFPGDSLLFTAGFLASQGFLHIGLLVPLCFLAAIGGDSIGYAFGRKIGPKIFTREDSFFFHKKHVERTQHFYEQHGQKTILLARFIPIVRTFAPILAGVGRMPYERFLIFNVLGGFIWSVGFLALGYFVGNIVPHAERYITLIIFVIVLTSFIPVIQVFMKRGKSGTPPSSL